MVERHANVVILSKISEVVVQGAGSLFDCCFLDIPFQNFGKFEIRIQSNSSTVRCRLLLETNTAITRYFFGADC